MATVAQVAKASLQRILVQGSEADLEPDEYQDYIFALNNYMLAIDAEGVSLGFTEVADLGDEITIPVGALRGVIANMAIEVAPDYNGTISPGLVVAAEAGLAAMRRLGQRLGQTEYPCTLPIGSGHAGSFGRGSRSSAFYTCLEADILAETTGAIGLEAGTASGTVEVPVVSTITLTGTLNAFTAIAGTPSGEQDYTVSGSDLCDSIILNAPIDFEISTTSGSGFASVLTLPNIGGGVAETTIYVRYAPITTGSDTGAISHTSEDADPVTQPVVGTAISEFNPNVVPACCLWLGTDNMTDPNDAWIDQSVAGNDFEHEGVLDNTLEPDGSVVFTGAAGAGHFQKLADSGVLQSTSGGPLTGAEIYIVLKVPSLSPAADRPFNNAEEVYLKTDGNGVTGWFNINLDVGFSPFSDFTDYVTIRVTTNAVDSYGIRINGANTAVYSGAFTFLMDLLLRIGSDDAGNGWEGNLKMFALFDRPLTGSEVTNMDDYAETLK